MVKNYLKRCAAMALSLCLLFSCVQAPALATDVPEDSQTLFQPIKGVSEGGQSGQSDQRVKIIVELDEAPLLSYQNEMRMFSSNTDFFQSDVAKEIERELSENRKNFQKTLMRSEMDIEVEKEYSAVLNGFSVEADYGDLETIKNMDGVKNAFISGFYQQVEPVENLPFTTESVPAIGGDIVGEDFGYTGKSTVVAIIDTGLDMSHPAFAGVNNPKYTEDDIDTLIKNNKLTIGKLNVSSVYQSEKIPFAYDYADIDTNVSGGASHGTHVAGIVGANSGGVIQGVAPDAQFFIMKVFGDSSGGAYDSDILAALDDAVKLGADSVNMSLGSAGGFSEDAAKTIRQAYERVEEAGVALYCAAGNDYSATRNNIAGNDLPKATETDNSIVGSPSTYAAALSVASMNNVKSTSIYFFAGDLKIRYNDSSEDKSMQLVTMPGSYEYMDCGVGATTDFAGKDLKGKIALIRRGGQENGENLSFSNKEANAKAAGAVAAVIYDNVAGELVSMATENKIPCVFISQKDGEAMILNANKTMSISEDYIDQFQDAYSGKMSDFSSWGATADLKLKPEITAPGGDIYSTLPNGLYGNMSGTSMASPHMAGAAAIMDQYIREKLDGLNMTQGEKTQLSNALMMSTAAPIRDQSGNLYSPRKQGAGLVQLQNAVKSGAYLLSDVGGRPKAELGAKEDGSYTFSMQAVSISDAPIDYEVAVTVLTEDTVIENGVTYMAQYARTLTSDEVTVNVENQFILEAKGKKTVPVTITLTEQGKKNLKESFPNGVYVEGFVTLTPLTDGEVTLSYPFMGYYGNLADLSLFDSDIYDDEKASLYEMQIGQFRNSDGGGYILGQNIYVEGSTEFNADKIAIKGGDNTKHVTAATSLLRNVDALTFSAEDSEGGPVYTETMKNVVKTYYMDEAFHTPMADKGWIPYDTWNTPLDDGNYVYKVTAQTGDDIETVSFPIVIDSVNPEVVSSTIEGSQWKVTVHDNHYIQAVCATATGSTPLTKWMEPEASEAGATTELIFDLSDSAFKGLSQAKIAMIDYAGNQFVSDYYTLSGAVVVYPESITLDKKEISINAGSNASLTATVLPENASNRTVKWQSSDQTVATVNNAGLLSALKEGEATITAETVNGLKAECKLTVREQQSVTDTVIASVSAPAQVTAGAVLPFDFQLEKMTKVATVSFTFEKDSDLTYVDLSGKNGFTPLGVKWNGNTGVAALSYLQDGAGGSLTKAALTDIVQIQFKTLKNNGSSGIRLTGISVAGYDKDGESIFLTSEMGETNANISIADQNLYDLNGDGMINLLDITYCQMYYQATNGSANWSEISKCDLDGNDKIDIQDLIILLQAI